MIGELIRVAITGSKAKVLAGEHSVDEYYLKQIFRYLPKTEDMDSVEPNTLGFVSLDEQFGFYFNSTLVSSRSVGEANRTVSRILPVRPESLIGFYENPVLLGYFLSSSGNFRETTNTQALLPDLSLFEPVRWAAEFRDAELSEIARSVEIHDRGVVVCGQHEMKYLAGIYSQMRPSLRWTNSFCIGSRISQRRNFSLHLTKRLDSKAISFLNDNQIRYFDFGACPN